MQYAYPLLAILIWAGNTVINKLAVGAIFPSEIGFYRWLLAGLLFTPFMLKPVMSNWPIIRPNLGKIFILGVLGMAVYQSLAYYAAARTSATNMGIILSLMPLMVLSMSIISLGQRLTAGALVGAVVSFVGVLVVVSSGSLAALLDHGLNLGDAMMLVATLAYAVYSTLLKKWQLRLPPLQMLYMQVLVAIVVLFPLYLAWRQWNSKGLVLEPTATLDRGFRGRFGKGLLTGFSNPKTIVMFSAVFPQFAGQGSATRAQDLVVLGLAFLLLQFASGCLYCYFGQRIRQVLQSPSRQVLLQRATACMLLGVAVMLARGFTQG